MDAKTFFKEVALMRNAQKEYFKTRSRSSLERSKHHESIIDKEIKRVAQMRPDVIPQEPTIGNIFNLNDDGNK